MIRGRGRCVCRAGGDSQPPAGNAKFCCGDPALTEGRRRNTMKAGAYEVSWNERRTMGDTHPVWPPQPQLYGTRKELRTRRAPKVTMASQSQLNNYLPPEPIRTFQTQLPSVKRKWLVTICDGHVSNRKGPTFTSEEMLTSSFCRAWLLKHQCVWRFLP